MDGLSERVKRILNGKNCYKLIFENKNLQILYDEDLNLTSIGWMIKNLNRYKILLLEKIFSDKNKYSWYNKVIFENNYIVLIYDNKKINLLFKYLDITEFEIEIIKKLFKE